jgi:hypothetical protein
MTLTEIVEYDARDLGLHAWLAKKIPIAASPILLSS